ncbi:MAG: hypothetical protein HQL51_09610 [Magnetococcales bacterium]|nr:hypothetical protein [Magnetococcales bacterium]
MAPNAAMETTRGWVVLVLKGAGSSPRVARYALHLAGRMEAGLDVLLLSARGREPNLLKALRREAAGAGIDCRLTRLAEEDPWRAMGRYAHDHRRVLMAVVDSDDLPPQGKEGVGRSPFPVTAVKAASLAGGES